MTDAVCLSAPCHSVFLYVFTFHHRSLGTFYCSRIRWIQLIVCSLFPSIYLTLPSCFCTVSFQNIFFFFFCHIDFSKRGWRATAISSKQQMSFQESSYSSEQRSTNSCLLQCPHFFPCIKIAFEMAFFFLFFFATLACLPAKTIFPLPCDDRATAVCGDSVSMCKCALFSLHPVRYGTEEDSDLLHNFLQITFCQTFSFQMEKKTLRFKTSLHILTS